MLLIMWVKLFNYLVLKKNAMKEIGTSMSRTPRQYSSLARAPFAYYEGKHHHGPSGVTVWPFLSRPAVQRLRLGPLKDLLLLPGKHILAKAAAAPIVVVVEVVVLVVAVLVVVAVVKIVVAAGEVVK